VDQRRVSSTDGLAVVSYSFSAPLTFCVSAILASSRRRDRVRLHGIGGRGLLSRLRRGGGSEAAERVCATDGAAVCSAAWAPVHDERIAIAAPPVPAATNPRVIGLVLTTVPYPCGHGEFLSGAYEVSCRVRAGDARPRRDATSPQAVRLSGPAYYLGPPLLPHVDECWVIADSERRQDSAIRSDCGDRKPGGPTRTSRCIPPQSASNTGAARGSPCVDTDLRIPCDVPIPFPGPATHRHGYDPAHQPMADLHHLACDQGTCTQSLNTTEAPF